MIKELILTPEELYYMGRFMQAKYIDYAYIAAMSDIRQNYALFEKEAQAALVSAGILMEDFSGNVEIDSKAAAVLKPIFFGEVETSVDICYLGETNAVSVNKFHFYDGAVTMVAGSDGKLIIRSIDKIDIHEFVSGLLSKDFAGKYETVTEFDKDKITRFIAVKSVDVGKVSVVNTYIESDGAIYHEKGSNIESITRDMFIEEAYSIVKGV